MDAEKVAFLFDDLPRWADPEVPDERGQFLIGRIDPDQPGAALQNTVREVIATQIADDDPPEVWRTARRLLAAGLDRPLATGPMNVGCGGGLHQWRSGRADLTFTRC